MIVITVEVRRFLRRNVQGYPCLLLCSHQAISSMLERTALRDSTEDSTHLSEDSFRRHTVLYVQNFQLFEMRSLNILELEYILAPRIGHKVRYKSYYQ